jgi:hypothetical protein
VKSQEAAGILILLMRKVTKEGFLNSLFFFFGAGHRTQALLQNHTLSLNSLFNVEL